MLTQKAMRVSYTKMIEKLMGKLQTPRLLAKLVCCYGVNVCLPKIQMLTPISPSDGVRRGDLWGMTRLCG